MCSLPEGRDDTGCVSGFCFGGMCEATSCVGDADCASGECTISYEDLDGDGFGNDTNIGRCDGVIPPGYVTYTGDCCDIAGSSDAKKVHPFVYDGYPEPSTCPGVGFDYDCSGTEDRDYMSIDCDDLCFTDDVRKPENVCGEFYTAVIKCVWHADTETCDTKIDPQWKQPCF